MKEIDQNQKIYNEFKTKFFKQHFLNKNITQAAYETIRSALLSLTADYFQFVMIEDCLSAIRKDKSYFSKLSKKTQRTIRIFIIGLKSISKEIFNILEPISQGMEMETDINENKTGF